VGGFSGWATGNESSGEWYNSVRKPFFQPPGWVFGPVWTTLYFLMGVSLYLIIRSAKSEWRNRALVVFGIQLILNCLWSFIFFKWHELGWASAEIIVLWLAIAAMIASMWKVRRAAALLQIPYICWVSFATVLTITIWRLNS